MAEEKLNDQAIFEAARRIDSHEARATYLQQSCGKDLAQAERIGALLRAFEENASFLESPPIDFGLAPTFTPPLGEKPGTQIGPYKLIEQIGEGGMGTVWMAQQSEPVKRLVAVKLIKSGLDSRQVLARFEAERQALALMDHPNIAKVLDAGKVGDSGRPYFVMELVKGVPITRYCDEHHLTPRQRLELFVPVCHAIQHAHQKGIIHRDIKPNNVLVASYDDKPVPKIIDFGVAKATGQQLTDLTLNTGFGAVVGTLEYMSPEQAGFNQLDIDTRSDVYSLGVLLYELLSGSPPFQRKDLEQAGLLEMLRVIREQEPSKPSTKLSSSAALPSLSANRSTEPARLTRLVRGELDWIVMKAMEKDRSRRYETANGFADDVRRYLADDPVQACPPSAIYRLRKFTRRNKAVLMTAGVFALALLMGTVISAWQAVIAKRALAAESAARVDADEARRQAKAEAQKAKIEAAIAQAVNDFLNRDLLAQANDAIAQPRYSQQGSELTLLTVLNRAAGQIEGRFKDQPLVEAALRQTIGSTYQSLGGNPVDLSRAAKHLQRAMELRRQHLGDEHPETLLSMADFAIATQDAALCERVLQTRVRVLGKDDPATLESIFHLAYTLDRSGDKALGLKMFREALEAQRRVLGEDHFSTAWTKHLVACVQHHIDGNTGPDGLHGEEIERLYLEALTTSQTKSGEGSWYTYDVTLRLGQFLSFPGHYEKAEQVLLDGYARLKAHPSTPPEWSATLAGELTRLYRSWNKPEEAAAWDQKQKVDAEATLVRSTRIVQNNSDDTSLSFSHAALLIQSDRLDEAEAASQSAIAVDPQAKEEIHHLLGDAYIRRRDWAKAERHYAQALAIRRELLGAESTQVGNMLHALSVARREKGDLPAAEAAQSEAVAIFRKRFGDDHPATAIEVHDLAFVLGRIPGREAEAERLFREALTVRRRVLGEGDAVAADTAFRLAQVLGAQGKFDEVETLLQESHASLAANRGSESAREFEPVLVQWIVEQYQNWGKPERAAAWERKLSSKVATEESSH